jgi:hypothetical protein
MRALPAEQTEAHLSNRAIMLAGYSLERHTTAILRNPVIALAARR